jgi:polysaccharide export outer membrane protein
MMNETRARVGCQIQSGGRSTARLTRVLTTAAAAFLLTVITGCQTAPSSFSDPDALAKAKADAAVLQEGDTVRFTFPGAPSVNTVQQIRQDGKIALPLLGELAAAGRTPGELRQDLLNTYGSQLQTKDVTITVERTAFGVYVSGAVLRPGKVTSDRTLTALQAIMEAGGFDATRANPKSVRIIRNEKGQTEHHTVNLKRVLDGTDDDSFKLKSGDILFVPERFNWF